MGLAKAKDKRSKREKNDCVRWYTLIARLAARLHSPRKHKTKTHIDDISLVDTFFPYILFLRPYMRIRVLCHRANTRSLGRGAFVCAHTNEHKIFFNVSFLIPNSAAISSFQFAALLIAITHSLSTHNAALPIECHTHIKT